ncbi:MAG: hypothetical protein ACLP8S_14720 [Solirubrobacteraceae bacterium]|jgi:hypothetical protein
MTDAGDFPRMGFISYHRACVAKRQARAAIHATRELGDELEGVYSRSERLIEIVEHQSEMIERLEQELDHLRGRLDDR